MCPRRRDAPAEHFVMQAVRRSGETAIGIWKAVMFRLRLTTFKTMTTSPTASAAIITMVVALR